jgi:hypothetical protein
MVDIKVVPFDELLPVKINAPISETPCIDVYSFGCVNLIFDSSHLSLYLQIFIVYHFSKCSNKLLKTILYKTLLLMK